MNREELISNIDRLWEEWKLMNNLPKSNETAYLNQMWFFYYMKKNLAFLCVDSTKEESKRVKE
jgi:hypothetical protein